MTSLVPVLAILLVILIALEAIAFVPLLAGELATFLTASLTESIGVALLVVLIALLPGVVGMVMARATDNEDKKERLRQLSFQGCKWALAAGSIIAFVYISTTTICSGAACGLPGTYKASPNSSLDTGRRETPRLFERRARRRLAQRLGSRMNRILPSIAVLLASFSCQAGYYEYQLLAQSFCEAFAITTDAIAPNANAADVSPEYKAYVSSTGRSPTSFWALNGNPESPTRWADCNQTTSEITCTVIGDFKFQSFTCRLGQSNEWSRSCTSADGKVGELKIYSVDTREYELGGEPVKNRYLLADLAKFETRCKKGSAHK